MPLPTDFWEARLARFCGTLAPPDWLAYDPPAWEWPPRALGYLSGITIYVHEGVVDETIADGPADEMGFGDGLGTAPRSWIAGRRIDEGVLFPEWVAR